MISPHRSGAVTNRNGFALNDALKSSDASAVNIVVTPQPGHLKPVIYLNIHGNASPVSFIHTR